MHCISTAHQSVVIDNHKWQVYGACQPNEIDLSLKLIIEEDEIYSAFDTRRVSELLNITQ